MEKIYCYIDESGIHKRVDHSAFCLVYVVVENREEIERAIVEIEQRHKIKPFHWVNVPWKLRELFLNDLLKLSFSAKVAVVRNPIRPREAFIYALRHLMIENNFTALFVDGKKPRWVEFQLKKLLRDKGITVKKVKTVRRDSSPGVRIADALAGLTRAYYDNPNGKASPLWKKLSKKITTQLVGGQGQG